MPIEFGIWRIDEGVVPVPSSRLANAAKLEDILEQDLSLLGVDVLLLIGRQVITALGKRIDLLAMDVNGDLYAIELKRGQTPREVVAQTIDYGYWIRDLVSDDVVEAFDKHNPGVAF
jgi:RecB family endonuclease NucS